jgi:predicted neuraminidase
MASFIFFLTMLTCGRGLIAQNSFQSELIFPLDSMHNHAPSLVEYPNGDLLVCWYRGSGERQADDVSVLGSWKLAGSDVWSQPKVMADQQGFPDCNTSMHLGEDGKLWLFWPTVIANSWESCLTRYKTSQKFDPETGPVWGSEGIVLLKPDDFESRAEAALEQAIAELPNPLPDRLAAHLATLRTRISDKLYQRLGWQPRCKPTVLPSGRMLLPLYSDTFSASIMAITDDGGESWFASKPIIGLGNIQPSVLRRDDGTLVAYMRENGMTGRIRVSESSDDGMSWTPVTSSDLVHSGSGLDALRLTSGDWIIVYNDTESGRSSLAISVSKDEGRTWPITKHLEKTDSGSYHYPAVIQGRDDKIYVVYSFFVEAGKSMKLASFAPEWLSKAN